jgi:hypothetical protein
MTWTVADIISWRTCYTAERVRELLTDPVTPETIAALDIPPADRACLLLRHESLGPRRQLQVALGMAHRLLLAGQDATELHAFAVDDSMRPDDCAQPLTWLLVRLSARLHYTGVMTLDAQLPFIVEAYNGR